MIAPKILKQGRELLRKIQKQKLIWTVLQLRKLNNVAINVFFCCKENIYSYTGLQPGGKALINPSAANCKSCGSESGSIPILVA